MQISVYYVLRDTSILTMRLCRLYLSDYVWGDSPILSYMQTLALSFSLWFI